MLLKNRLKGYFFSALGYRLLQQLYTHEKHFVCEFFPFKIDGTWMQRKILPRHFPTVWLKVITRNENILTPAPINWHCLNVSETESKLLKQVYITVE